MVLNEIDYDQVGADAGGFVELYNAGLGAAELDGLGARLRRRRGRRASTCAALERLARSPASTSSSRSMLRTARPTGSRSTTRSLQGVVDALSYEGAIERAFIGAFAHTLVEGNPLPAAVADSNTVTGSLARIPNGSDTDDVGDRLGVHDHRHAGRSPMFRLAAPLRAHVRAALRGRLGPALPLLGLESLVEPPFEVRQLALQLVVALPAVGRQRSVCRAPPGWRSPARCRGRSRRSGTAFASSSTSLNVSARPSDDSQSCSSRSPGVSTTSPPPGSRTSWRCRVVWRPSPSCSRIVCVASSSSPASVFTSVDLPTPGRAEQRDRPARQQVGADQVEAVAGQARDRVDRHAEGDRLDLEHLQRMVAGRGRSSSARSPAGRRSPTPSSRSAPGGGG